CNKLLRDATTISECLHTFCRKCIFEKLNDEEVDCCPVCNIDLGCAPLEKLRADHNRQDIRAKIFPLKRTKVDAPEIVPSIVLPVKRKERSLSSLVVNTPRVSTHSGLTGRRTKSTARRASSLRGLGPIIEEPSKEVKNDEDHAETSSQSRRKISSTVDTSDYTLNKNTDYTKGSPKDKSELWKPLNCLVEAANRTKAVKSSSQSSDIKEEQINGADSEVVLDKVKVKEHPSKPKIQEDNNNNTSTSSVKVRAQRLQRKRKRDLENSAQALVDAASATHEGRNCPIWLALVPAIDQKGDAVLPRTSTCYLRIKDGNLPVSFVRKYLVKKHNLVSESEVEITCRGQIVNPALPLYNLAEIWLQSQPPQRVQATIGTSAKDFVLVLNYSQRAPAS
ncbi:E3 ubiquitin protein ligase DRIP2-like, partial [Asparagus officinalis]|uniref:E3 ubiquitin protein ligase DRIP2-like n=1 Tax=Asparagus officinalis TaxID=4686 RepID=UPI00098E25FE